MRPGDRRSTVVAGTLVCIAALVSACSSGTTSPTTTGTSGGAATTAPTVTTTTGAPSTTTTTTSTTSTTTAAPTGVQNLSASAQVKAELLAAFVAMRGMSAADVQGPSAPVYYAYDPATSTYWAAGSFSPTPAAPQQVGIDLQDGGGFGLFTMRSGSAWSAQTGSVPPYCAWSTYFPPAVLQAWAITKPPTLTC